MTNALDISGQRLLAFLIKVLETADPKNPQTFTTYKRVHDALNLPFNGPTYGESLKSQGLSSLADWTASEGKPAITGVIVDGTSLMPGKGYFSLFNKTEEDFKWWINQIRLSKEYDWSLYFMGKPISGSSPQNGKNIPFESLRVGNRYTRKDLYELFNVPGNKQGGNWDTGYTKWNDDFFIFCNVGSVGRTGHDYDNRFVGDDLVWYAKGGSKLNQPSVLELIKPPGNVYLFYRTADRNPFTYAGRASAVSYEDTSPVKITWGFPFELESRSETLPEEVPSGGPYVEGSTKQITVNTYERNPQARADCLGIHGTMCSVCSFDFSATYGEIGVGYIHVHHLKQLSDIGESYRVDPTVDLIPVCPNCHAMLHKKNPPYSINELKAIMKTAQSKNGADLFR